MPRLLAFTDTHGRVEAAEEIVRLMPEGGGDAIVCAGDFSFFGRRCEDHLDVLARLSAPVHFVPGNHESARFAREAAARWAFLREVSPSTREAGGVRIIGLPGTAEYAFGARDDDGPVRLAVDLWRGLERDRPLVLLSHYPPCLTAVDGNSHSSPDGGGSRLVRRIVEALQPALLVCGHYHGDFGKSDRIGDTRVVNPGPLGMWIDLPGPGAPAR